MNPFEMVVMIVAIVMIAGVFRTRSRAGGPAMMARQREDAEETRRLRAEVNVLKERVAVLERIATDKGSLLEQEIEQLRDRSAAIERAAPSLDRQP
ncbi:MAG: hypothetical protein ACM3YM_08030 [Sphingomonadales bacterium]